MGGRWEVDVHLLLLPPEHLLWQVGLLRRVEGGAQQPFLELLRGRTLANHLVLSCRQHGRVEHVLVQEGHADLEAVRHRRLVGAQAVVLAEVGHLAHALLVQLGAVGRLRKRSKALRSAQKQSEAVTKGHQKPSKAIGSSPKHLVEVEIARERLVGALARHDHLDAHRLDLAREEEHGRAGANGRHVVRLEVVDDI